MELLDVLSWWCEVAVPVGTLGGFLAGSKWQKWRSSSASGHRAAATGGDSAPAVTGDAAQITTGDNSPIINQFITIERGRSEGEDECQEKQ